MHDVHGEDESFRLKNEALRESDAVSDLPKDAAQNAQDLEEAGEEVVEQELDGVTDDDLRQKKQEILDEMDELRRELDRIDSRAAP
ncbi:MAG: hypothetical protein SVY41_02350 [Candidatus Nanohaloarchaea archaeon]|nr:hypothetical protein [Candidatus Nanohaloarchaea archaeon]